MQKIELDQLRRAAPFALPVVILLVAWIALIRPLSTEVRRAATQAEMLRTQLARARAVVAQAPPPAVQDDPAAAFAGRVAAGDVTSELLEQLARLALGSGTGSARNLLIETGERAEMATTADGPQASGAVQPDPRLTLFDVPLVYTPVTISFDAEYAEAGRFLWRLRDLATTVEMRSLNLIPVEEQGLVHVSLSLFAYSRPSTPGVARHAFAAAAPAGPTPRASDGALP